MLDGRVFSPPGSTYLRSRAQINQFLDFMGAIRDHDLHDYPVLPGAINVFQSIVSGREAKVTAKTATAAQRAVEWINKTQSPTHVGIVEYGYETFLRRRSLDYNVLGRTLLYAPPDEPMQYLDPVYVRYHFDENGGFWKDRYTGVQYPIEYVIVDHPKPIGASGKFTSPVMPLLPTAMLAWLVREHDLASADGRKIRDIILVGSQDLVTSLEQAIKDSLAAWAGAATSENGVPIAWIDRIEGSNLSMQDYVHTLSLANIPKDFPREMFEFNFANEISANLGVALRHFYNSERATNRALEEVQEARQQQKGPNLFTRTEERLMNRPGMIDRFGASVAFGFVEAADHATQEARGNILFAYARALLAFAKVFDGKVNGEAFLAWLQNDNILPADLELITEIGSLIHMDTPPSTNKEAPLNVGADLINTSKSIDIGELSVDLNGKIIEKRNRIFDVAKLVESELEPEINSLLTKTPINFVDALDKARKKNYTSILEVKEAFNDYLKSNNLKSVPLDNYLDLQADDHYLIYEFLEKNARI